MLKIICLSDTHCQLDKVDVPEGDILIHSGDLTYRGKFEETEKELKILKEKTPNFKHRILVEGNHDWLGEKEPVVMRGLCEENGIILLQHEAIELEGLKIFGSPFQPEFCNWAWNLPRGEALANKWKDISNDTQILITHSPPYHILDRCPDGRRVGCEQLKARIADLKDLRLHVFGHIHAGVGTARIDKITFINASICDEAYKTTNKPKIITL